MQIVIDEKAGFCHGVVRAIELAEEELLASGSLYCLGEIVHNEEEVQRLQTKGLVTITREEFSALRDATVLIRAHGEPPQTYEIAKQNNIRLIDASCAVVLSLQKKVKQSSLQAGVQVVIFGKPGHPEVIGLVGQTGGNALVIHQHKDLQQIDFSRPVHLYAQTTMGKEDYMEMANKIAQKMEQSGLNPAEHLVVRQSTCGQVSGRGPHLARFASSHDLVLFVAGKNSSNGKYLHEICLSANPNTRFISGPGDIEKSWFENVNKVGICGATSTPRWLMEKIALEIKNSV